MFRGFVVQLRASVSGKTLNKQKEVVTVDPSLVSRSSMQCGVHGPLLYLEGRPICPHVSSII